MEAQVLQLQMLQILCFNMPEIISVINQKYTLKKNWQGSIDSCFFQPFSTFYFILCLRLIYRLTYTGQFIYSIFITSLRAAK